VPVDARVPAQASQLGTRATRRRHAATNKLNQQLETSAAAAFKFKLSSGTCQWRFEDALTWGIFRHVTETVLTRTREATRRLEWGQSSKVKDADGSVIFRSLGTLVTPNSTADAGSLPAQHGPRFSASDSPRLTHIPLRAVVGPNFWGSRTGLRSPTSGS
jgi:hypothetical protein